MNALALARAIVPAVCPVLAGPLRGARWLPRATKVYSVIANRYEPEGVRRFAASVQAGSVVWDVGANVGVFTLLAARLVGDHGRVVAFEPAPGPAELLERHLVLNDLQNRVTVIRAAVSDGRRTARFHPATAHLLGSLEPDGEIEVPVTTLDYELSRGVAAPHVIKIDAEREEVRVLEGARSLLLERSPILFLSTHSEALRAQCQSLLRDLRYAASVFDETELFATPSP